MLYSYDALGRRLHKHSTAHHQDDPRAGSGWNQMQRATRQRALGCGYTLYGWDGDTLAWESSPPQAEGDTGRTVHYLYEPGSFVPVAQALRKTPIRLLRQPDWGAREYDIDQDPLWQHAMQPQPIDAIVWYQCDHLGTPMELTDHNGEVAWAGQYKAWGEIREVRSEWARQVGVNNPIRFQGQYHDHETGLHYNRYRYYDPRVGRFVSQDPISYAGGLNLFAYAPNPIFWVDTLGLTPTPLNEPGYIVYGLYRPDEENPYYVGHTKQGALKREAQHGQSGRLGNATLKPISEGLTYTQSKGQEQYYREVYDTKTGFPGSVIEPIDKSRQDERGRSHVTEYEKIKLNNACGL